MRRIVLLRSSSGPDDPYERALRGAGFEVESEPVLQFRFVNAAALRAALADRRFRALVLTSPRAADAIRRVGLPEHWEGGTAWTVGEETARRAEALDLQATGWEAGFAGALADRIIQSKPSPLLFVCGDRRRDALPDRLREGGVVVEEVTGYETVLKYPPLLEGEAPVVVAFFSPSGVDAAVRDAAFPWDARRVAIGPTTAQALADAGRPAHATAATPKPEAFAEAALLATA